MNNEIQSIINRIIFLHKSFGTIPFEPSFKLIKEIHADIKRLNKDSHYYNALFNLAAVISDIAHLFSNKKAADLAHEIIESDKDKFIELVDPFIFYYNYSNVKTNILTKQNPSEQTFKTVEELVELKRLIWKAIKSVPKDQPVPAECYINLSNALKQQFRIAEAMHYYKKAIHINPDLPQAWLNRSDSILLLSKLSNEYSLNMLYQAKKCYEKALYSDQIPIQSERRSLYWTRIDYFKKVIDETIKDDKQQSSYMRCCEAVLNNTQKGEYKEFCITNDLSLSEHSIFCDCSTHSDHIDDLSLSIEGINNSRSMEMVLNRLKSEFSLARSFYFEYFKKDKNDDIVCYFGNFEDESLSIEIEKLRTSFRLCFGILDKIGVAICELFDFYPPNKSVSFQSFWQLDRDNRRSKLESENNLALLALYSIATDLNDRKDGEWAFYKQWRNDLEHKFVIVCNSDNTNQSSSLDKLENDVVFINEAEFIDHLKRLLQITRSAIFSFSYAVKQKTIKENNISSSFIDFPV